MLTNSEPREQEGPGVTVLTSTKVILVLYP